MRKFKFLPKEKISQLPKVCGVYSFKNRKDFLYIGKAINIKERVKNHFQRPTFRDNLFLGKTKQIGFIETGSEIEAFLLEAEMIKKYRPRFNVTWRDDKNYFYVALVKEKMPYIFITHQKKENNDYIGPFVDGSALKKTLRFLRKIFPYYTNQNHPKGPCQWCHLGLCPGHNPNAKEYKKNIRNLIAVLRGKKKRAVSGLKKEMSLAAKNKNFEKAAKIRDKIFALESTLHNARIIEGVKENNSWENAKKVLQGLLRIKEAGRIEGYDISNIQGQSATGSMVVFLKGLAAKNFYRKFKIRISGKPNDTAMIREILERRFQHTEWPYPEIMLVDGGKAQFNAALEIKNKELRIKNIRVLALAKKKNELFVEGRKSPLLLKALPRPLFDLILQIRDEAHRFARAYHLKRREVDFALK